MIRTMRSMFLVIIFCGVHFLHALEVTILSTPQKSALGKNIQVAFALSSQELGFLKHTLQFSVDRDDMVLTAWNSAMQAQDVFVPAFKKSIKVVTQSSQGVLLFDSGAKSGEQRFACLQQASLTVSCLVVRKDGSIKPFLTVIPLRKQGRARKPREGSALAVSQIESGEIKTIPGIEVPNFDKDFEFINQLHVLWLRLSDFCMDVLQRMSSVWWMLGMLVLFALLTLRGRYRFLRFVVPVRGWWALETKVALLFCLSLGVLYGVRGLFDHAYVFYALAGLSCIGMLYAFTTPPYHETFLGRLKNLVGFFLGVAVLPLLLKAYLMQHGLL